jgi:hypothetical protein
MHINVNKTKSYMSNYLDIVILLHQAPRLPRTVYRSRKNYPIIIEKKYHKKKSANFFEFLKIPYVYGVQKTRELLHECIINK